MVRSMTPNMLTTTQAAKELKISRSRVLVLIRDKRLPAVKFGDAYVIERKDLAKVRVRKVGRPAKK